MLETPLATPAVLASLESIIRALNNLEQELSHGFYLYSLLGNGHFVSVGEYAITIALSSIALSSISLGAFPKVRRVFPSLGLWLLNAMLTVSGCWALAVPALASVSKLAGDVDPASEVLFTFVVLGCTCVSASFQNIAVASLSPVLISAEWLCVPPSRKGARPARVLLLLAACWFSLATSGSL